MSGIRRFGQLTIFVAEPLAITIRGWLESTTGVLFCEERIEIKEQGGER
jgi:hypothetical protein